MTRYYNPHSCALRSSITKGWCTGILKTAWGRTLAYKVLFILADILEISLYVINKLLFIFIHFVL